jgi:hypothetical protein
MSTGEGPDARDDRPSHEDHSRRGDRIGIGGGDDSVTRIQLAARWAESYGPYTDSLAAILKRFRAAYEYLDSVIHGVEPGDLDRDLGEVSRPLHQSGGAPSASAEPPEAVPSSSLPPAPTEPRSWG